VQFHAGMKFVGCCYSERWTQVQNLHDNRLLMLYYFAYTKWLELVTVYVGVFTFLINPIGM